MTELKRKLAPPSAYTRRVPVDCTVVSGETSINAALVTGESLPVAVAPGDELSVWMDGGAKSRICPHLRH